MSINNKFHGVIDHTKLFTISVYIIVLYIIIRFINLFQKDINILFTQENLKNLSHLQTCQLQYKENYCDPKTRVPGLYELCQDLTVCIDKYTKLTNKDVILKSELVIRHTMDLLNIVVERFNHKVLIVLLISILTLNLIIQKVKSSQLLLERDGFSEMKNDKNSNITHITNDLPESLNTPIIEEVL